MTEKNINQKLQIILTEYNTLRDEMHRKFDFHTTLLAAYGTVTIGFYTFLLNNKDYMDLILILPMLSLFFLFRFLWDQHIIHDISKYIEKNIELEKIPKILSEKEKLKGKKYILGLGWQNHYNKKSKSLSPYLPYWRFSTFIIFVIFSILPQISYNATHILKKWAPSVLETLTPFVFTHSEIPNTVLQPHIHLFLFLVNICICYYIIRKITNPYKSLKIERRILNYFR
ncbi:MAG: hypothetical protein KAQ92_04385 [Candidatus Aenigmarchaeota archaeon]|nr:hypothetical protein [Candidatus Aenigmarchaeota archaeon]